MVKGASEFPALRDMNPRYRISFTHGNLWPFRPIGLVIQAHIVSHLGPIRIQQDFSHWYAYLINKLHVDIYNASYGHNK